jgi:hypothetical protein
MPVTQEMIQAGVRRAVELGVLPRKSLSEITTGRAAKRGKVGTKEGQ